MGTLQSSAFGDGALSIGNDVGDTVAYDVATDTDGSSYATKLNAAGSYVWGETFGGTADDIGWGIAVDSFTDDVHLAGEYMGIVDFDPSSSIDNLTAFPSFTNAFLVILVQ